MEDFHRESCRRQHRVLGHYLAVHAWVRGLDCVVLVRSDLERFLGLKRFKSIRVGWLQEDLRPWFPHQTPYYRSGSPSSIHSLFLARIPMDAHLAPGTMTTDWRIARLAPAAPKTAKFVDTAYPWTIVTESDMVSQLALISSGLATPQQFKTKRKIT